MKKTILVIATVKRLDNLPSGKTETLYWDGKRFNLPHAAKPKFYKYWKNALKVAKAMRKSINNPQFCGFFPIELSPEIPIKFDDEEIEIETF